ncbi:serine hydrolase domain-containing protein [Agromyces marinus]|uniref:Beta-lactamase-related domain-containing protein n=1 Tax=Agromyces marinus TaxID=1389020 RepID=A0ABM8H247_9MICO|nr:serine hydrolase [Agromyces marinus]UIP60042.1 D-aminopeptidase [Agromyces marinus]BDZ54845.1 hypothetical protein GCM10025870_19180 [Agromyces marinus]
MRRRLVVATVAAACALVGLAGCTSAGSPAVDHGQVEGRLDSEVAERLDAALADAVRLSGSSGAVAGVWVPWSGTWTTGAGTVDFGDGATEATASTGFQLAAGTGQVTCAIMLGMVDRGDLRLDEPVSALVRGIPGLEGVTVEQLCRHDSGIADYYGPLRRFFVGNPERVWPAGELVASGLAADEHGEPGTTWAESGTGILLLAMGLEQHSGRSWADLAEEYVFGPLELEDTVIPAENRFGYDGALGGYAAGYDAEGARSCEVLVDVSERSSSIGGTDSGARTTLADAKAIVEAYAAGSLFTEATARKVWTLEPFGGEAPGWQSQGIGAQQYGPLRGVAGESVGALSAMYSDPASGLTVVVALNNSTSGEAFVREAAFALASIASKAPAVEDRERPLVELPWSFDQAVQRMTETAACPPPAEAGEDAAEEAPATEG